MHEEEAKLRECLMHIKQDASNRGDHSLSQMLEIALTKVDAYAKSVIAPTGARYKHEKRGSIYDVFGVGHANSSCEMKVSVSQEQEVQGVRHNLETRKVLFDRDEVVIYRDIDTGDISIRAVDEFHDGRFTLLQGPPAAPAEEPLDLTGKLSRPLGVHPALGVPYGQPEAQKSTEQAFRDGFAYARDWGANEEPHGSEWISLEQRAWESYREDNPDA